VAAVAAGVLIRGDAHQGAAVELPADVVPEAA
jgi:hypothetical protein